MPIIRSLKRKANLKKFIYIFALLLIISSVAIAGFFWLLHKYTASPTAITKKTTIIIPEGASVRRAAIILHEKNIINHPSLFYINWRINHNDIPIHAGEYLFNAEENHLSVIKKLMSGDIHHHQITIPEGFTSKQIIKKILKIQSINNNQLPEIKEGTLLPDTYNFTYKDTVNNIIDRISLAQESAIKNLWETRTNKDLSWNEIIILASIVEKETGIAGERATIAGVFMNRLKKNMLLQSDPTVIYAITDGSMELGRKLTKKDLRTTSPINTYMHKGLPPKPICHPGIKAIKAALHPKNTPYLYFVANGKGGHRFAKDLKTHNKNVVKYRKEIRN